MSVDFLAWMSVLKKMPAVCLCAYPKQTVLMGVPMRNEDFSSTEIFLITSVNWSIHYIYFETSSNKVSVNLMFL